MSKYSFKRQCIDIRDKQFHLIYDQLVTDQLPCKINLRDIIKLPVLSQGILGACTAHATSNAILFFLKRSQKKEFQPSRLYIYYFSRYIEKSIDVDSGCEIRNVMKAVAKYGACEEKLIPYNIKKFKIRPNDFCIKEGMSNIKNFRYLSIDQELINIKNCIFQGYPILLGIELYESSEYDENLKSGFLPIPDIDNEKYIGGHCVLLVGYNDQKKIFCFLNSWGEDVGDNGYFYVSYDYLLNNKLATDFWTIRYFD
jgi:C1A family cysteine protease